MIWIPHPWRSREATTPTNREAPHSQAATSYTKPAQARPTNSKPAIFDAMTPCNEPNQPQSNSTQHYPSHTYSSSSTSSTNARCGCRCTKPPAGAASWPVGCGADSTSAGASWTGVAVPPGSGVPPLFRSLRSDWPFAACLAACFAAFFSFLMRFLFLMSSGV
jgi:hypothetical protein